tara:strand:+ start:521 stop:754 length:234 start_codon:yes stop_codon:yes gene_type:complete
MPYHTKNSGYKNVNSSSVRMPKPLYKPRKDLSKLQKDLMKTHKKNHTPEHMKEMSKLMKKGYCFQQAHDITMKKIGK